MMMDLLRFTTLAVVTVVDKALCQKQQQAIPFAGVGLVRPLRSASMVSSYLPPRSTLNESESEIWWEAASNSSSSSGADDGAGISAANSSSSSEAEYIDGADTNSSSSSLSSAVYALEPVSKNSSDVVGEPGSTNSSATANITALEQELVETLEGDDQVTVLGEVQLGELLCESLVQAEDAPLLQVAISVNETLLVNQTSYSVTAGQLFTGGVGRRAWKGVVIDPEPAEDEAFAREVSMTWGEVCDVETFSLEITTYYTDGNTTLVKSVPCGLSGLEICIVEVALDFLPYSEPLAIGVNSTEESTRVRRRLGRTSHSRDRHPSFGGGLFEAFARRSAGGSRRLQSDAVEIQAIVFYSGRALGMMGVSATQMETMVFAEFADVNVGLANSEIGVSVTVVHQGSLPYEEGLSDSATKLGFMREQAEVTGLRDRYGADVVMLVGQLVDVCGLAYFLPDAQPGYSEYAYSAVNPNCFANMVVAHELGHTLGCEHNREHSSTEMEYAHGNRYCSGTMYATIMSYTNDCSASRVNYFANPDVSFLDRPTGSDTANCARAIQGNREVVSNFRADSETEEEEDGFEEEDDGFDLWDRGKHLLFFVPIGVAFYFLKRRCLQRNAAG